MSESRSEQRRRALIALTLEKAEADGMSSATLTNHLDEIDMTRLEQEKRYLFKDYTAEDRRRMARAGQAMPDGSFPIANCQDASNARQSVGRAAPGKRASVRRHIEKRERALGCSKDD